MSQISSAELLNQGILLHRSGRLVEAEASYRAALEKDPQLSDALHLLGVARWQSGQSDEGVLLINQAIKIQPHNSVYYSNLGTILIAQRRFDLAVESCRRAVAIGPEMADARCNLGVALANCGNLDEAVLELQESLRLDPNLGMAWLNLGKVLRRCGRTSEAPPVLQKACTCLGHSQTAAESWIELGTVHAETFNAHAAVSAFEEALQICGAAGDLSAQARNGLGVALNLLGRVEEAESLLRQALQIRPEFTEASVNLANSLSRSGRLDEAIQILRVALHRNPKHAEAHSGLVYLMLFDPRSDEAAIKSELKRWNDTHAAALGSHPFVFEAGPLDKRLRVGYVSPDFRDHVVGRNILPLLENHNPEQIETFCYSNSTSTDAMTTRFRRAAQHWRDISRLSDDAVASLIHGDRIDILVDLSLHMAKNRLMVFARKPAPVQVTFAGYPGSTGLESLAYRLTDPYLDPPDRELPYEEQSIRLPHSFWCYDPLGEEIAVNELPALESGQITFGCLNTPMKINEDVLALWSDVLRATPGSRLTLLSAGAGYQSRVANCLGKFGIAGNRIHFVKAQPRRQFLEYYHRIDISLDTFPYNGHTTSLESLWMGVPVVTSVGRTVVGRAGLSQLRNLHHPELVAQTADQFVQIASALAKDILRLKGLRSSLRGQMLNSPLMDNPRFATDIERVYRSIWHNYAVKYQTKSLSQ